MESRPIDDLGGLVRGKEVLGKSGVLGKFRFSLVQEGDEIGTTLQLVFGQTYSRGVPNQGNGGVKEGWCGGHDPGGGVVGVRGGDRKRDRQGRRTSGQGGVDVLVRGVGETQKRVPSERVTPGETGDKFFNVGGLGVCVMGSGRGVRGGGMGRFEKNKKGLVIGETYTIY